jgi:hypothetical protein
MPCTPKPILRYRREYAKERREHPSLPPSAIKKIVRDHAKARQITRRMRA